MALRLPFRLRTLAATTVVIASGLIIFYSYQSIIHSSDETPKALPIIHADDNPFRVLPENPGGVEIVNKESTLFAVMDATGEDPLALSGVTLKPETEPETLFDDDSSGRKNEGFVLPEILEKRTESLYGIIEDLKDRPDTNEDISVEKEPLKADEKNDLKEKLQAVIAKADQTIKAEKEVAISIEKKENSALEKGDTVLVPLPSSKPTPPLKIEKQKKKSNAGKEMFSLDRILSKTPPKKGYYIQLASLRNEADARAAYDRIRSNFPNLVKGVSVVFPKADLGSRGTFTRIQIGPMSQHDAQSRCGNYSTSAKGGTCLVLSR